MSTVNRPKILVTHSKVSERCIQLLQEKCDVIICEGLPCPSREEILKKCKDVDGILWATLECLDDEVLNRTGPQLKAISSLTVGTENIDITEIKKRGIALGYTSSISAEAVAELAIGLMISAGRRFHESHLTIKNNQWKLGDIKWMLGQDIKGSTVGFVGLGKIGQEIAKRLKSFSVEQILYSGHSEKNEAIELNASFVSFEELLSRSDYIFVTCPLNSDTRHLFNKFTFAKMKKTSVFINVSRGGVVVQDDLVEALKTGVIFSAGLDVMTPEPLPKDHELVKLPNCILTPHLGSATEKTRNDMCTVAAKNVLNGIEGKPLIYSID